MTMVNEVEKLEKLIRVRGELGRVYERFAEVPLPVRAAALLEMTRQYTIAWDDIFKQGDGKWVDRFDVEWGRKHD